MKYVLMQLYKKVKTIGNQNYLYNNMYSRYIISKIVFKIVICTKHARKNRFIRFWKKKK